MKLKDYIGEATAYDKKLMLERKDPTSWLKSVESSSESHLPDTSATKTDMKTGRKAGMKTSMKTGRKTSDAIIASIKQTPEISIAAIAEKLGRARSSIAEQIEKLKAAGRIRRVGPDKGGHWEVVK